MLKHKHHKVQIPVTSSSLQRSAIYREWPTQIIVWPLKSLFYQPVSLFLLTFCCVCAVCCCFFFKHLLYFLNYGYVCRVVVCASSCSANQNSTDFATHLDSPETSSQDRELSGAGYSPVPRAWGFWLWQGVHLRWRRFLTFKTWAGCSLEPAFMTQPVTTGRETHSCFSHKRPVTPAFETWSLLCLLETWTLALQGTSPNWHLQFAKDLELEHAWSLIGILLPLKSLS